MRPNVSFIEQPFCSVLLFFSQQTCCGISRKLEAAFAEAKNKVAALPFLSRIITVHSCGQDCNVCVFLASIWLHDASKTQWNQHHRQPSAAIELAQRAPQPKMDQSTCWLLPSRINGCPFAVVFAIINEQDATITWWSQNSCQPTRSHMLRMTNERRYPCSVLLHSS